MHEKRGRKKRNREKTDRRGIPTEKECFSLLKKMNVPENVIEHIHAVTLLALKVGELIRKNGGKIDKALLRAGAVLHDIGRCRDHGILHGVKGAEIVRRCGLAEEIALIIERHIGAGISAKEAEKLGLPPKDFIPSTVEEKVVAACDNLIRGTEKIPLREVKTLLEEKGKGHLYPPIEKLHREVSMLAGTDLDEVSIPSPPGKNKPEKNER